MSNHYHLALETPLGNLASGMQWLQATFANRFNRLRDERGHLFQSRYKALLVEPGEALARVCDYIHLNPVRARIVSVAQLGTYRDSGYWYLQQPRARPSFLLSPTALAACGLPDTPAGRRCYDDYLAWQAVAGPAGKNAAYVCLSDGWLIGTAEFRERMLLDPQVLAATRRCERHGPDGAMTLRWSEALAAALAQVPMEMRACRHRSAAWKRAVALHLHETIDVPNGWLAQHLDMGSAAYVSKHLGLTRRRLVEPVASLLRRLKKGEG